jgi:hypothetical protein
VDKILCVPKIRLEAMGGFRRRKALAKNIDSAGMPRAGRAGQGFKKYRMESGIKNRPNIDNMKILISMKEAQDKIKAYLRQANSISETLGGCDP